MIRFCMAAILIFASTAPATPPPAPAEDPAALVRRATELYERGSMREAAEAFEQAREAGGNAIWTTYNAACAWARAGNKDRALASLEALADRGYADARQIRTDADLASLRSERRYQAVVQRIERAQSPCAADADRKQFDFWLGTWNVTDRKSGRPAGTSRVEKILRDCVVVENWTGAGGNEGKSFNVFDARAKTWRQYWVSSTGTSTVYEGTRTDQGMRLTARGPADADRTRMTFTPSGDGSVRQHGERSSDGGATWTTTFDLQYVPSGK